MEPRCRNCKNLVINEEGEFECKCWDRKVDPDDVCAGCPYSRICYILFDRVPLIEEMYKK